jgi:NAD(P)-dependent dehydrogenase (short-subunit alcohol dehydrogenase family)
MSYRSMIIAAIVTGSTSGIGLGIARSLAAQGNPVTPIGALLTNDKWTFDDDRF